MRKIMNRRLEVLRDIWLFDRCTRRELEALESVATALSVPAGRTLVRQGELGREFVVIMSGRAEVVYEDTRLAVLGPGSFFGEMSLLDRKPRTASVTTLEPTEILVLTTVAFNDVTTTMPSVDRKLMKVLVERLRDVEAKYVPASDHILDDFLFAAPAHSSASPR
jgi:CRP/FNR family transcriptional regulator, cyclic AMP receptor protein